MKLRLTKLEIKIMQMLMSGSYETIKQLSEETEKSNSRVSSVLKDLENKGFVDSEKKGFSKKVYLASNKHVAILKNLFSLHPALDFSTCLSDSALEILSSLAYGGSDISYIVKYSGFSERTVYRVLGTLKERGIVISEEGVYRINPRFDKLSEFVMEFQSYLNVRRVSHSSTLIWQRGKEFLVETREKRDEDKFFLTAYRRLSDFGIQLISGGYWHYFHSPFIKDLKPEDVCLHTIVMDPSSTRNLLYVLLTIYRIKIDWSYLKDESTKYGLYDTVVSLEEYLSTEGKTKKEYFPTWDEFIAKVREYDV